MRNGHVDKGGGTGGGGLRGARVVGRALRGHVTMGNLGRIRGKRERQARRPLLPGWALNPGRGRRGGARECVSLSSHLRRSSRRERRGGGGCFVQLWLPPPPLLLLDSSSLRTPRHHHTSMGSRPPCRHFVSARPRRHQLPPPWPWAARAPGAPGPGAVPRSRRPQPRLARRSARPN